MVSDPHAEFEATSAASRRSRRQSNGTSLSPVRRRPTGGPRTSPIRRPKQEGSGIFSGDRDKILDSQGKISKARAASIGKSWMLNHSFVGRLRRTPCDYCARRGYECHVSNYPMRKGAKTASCGNCIRDHQSCGGEEEGSESGGFEEDTGEEDISSSKEDVKLIDFRASRHCDSGGGSRDTGREDEGDEGSCRSSPVINCKRRDGSGGGYTGLRVGRRGKRCDNCRNGRVRGSRGSGSVSHPIVL